MFHGNRVRGLTMLEALVSMLVMAIGLLGAFSLLQMSVQNNLQANNRNHALYLSQAIIDKAKMNKFAISEYLYNDGGDIYPNGKYQYKEYTKKSENANSCGNCTDDYQRGAYKQAAQDVNLWADELENKLPGAMFSIYTVDASKSQYGVWIVWPNVSYGKNSTETSTIDELVTVFSL